MLEMNDNQFNTLRKYAKEHYGINLSDEKKSLVYSRLKPLIQEQGFKSFGDYCSYLVHDKSGMAGNMFIDRISTNHTYFMREKDHFEYLVSVVFPYLESNYLSEKDIRIWSAGCSTGEEPYTLQILLKEYFMNKPGWDTKLLATDVSETALQKAYNGIYTKKGVSALPPIWVKKYFIQLNDSEDYVIRDFIKEDVLFRRFNLMNEAYNFKKRFQVIFCRNVMIYFDAETRRRLVDKLFDTIDEGGYLFIGHSESLNHTDAPFEYIMPAVYRKKA